ncbi:hypothetical protein [Varibaculum cambriense]|uniref:Uncharacterized protein n=1 Tax=Varibaculum cambriense TaxID=184870 RepID=A0AAJ1BAW3_9ACTO|nr:hypothetical protein [Varibaculum cambriense]
MSTPPPILHATAKNAETLVQTDWQNLALSTGWAAVSGHTPRICKVGQIVFLTGAVLRQAGGAYTSIATIPAGYRPSATQFIGAGVTNKGGQYELYVDNRGILQCASYEAAGSQAGIVMPIAAIFIPV